MLVPAGIEPLLCDYEWAAVTIPYDPEADTGSSANGAGHFEEMRIDRIHNDYATQSRFYPLSGQRAFPLLKKSII
jgi:hypothetical protein